MDKWLEFVQNNLLYVVLAVGSGGMLLWQGVRGAAGAGSVSPMQATLMLNREDAILLDVREAPEWNAGHIPNARHVELGQLEKRLPELEKFKGRPVIVHCQSGNRSANAYRTLKKHGFERVYNLAGGIGAWKDAGLPLSTK